MKKKIQGTLNRPRLYIFKSNKHIYAQIIDDAKAKILVAISSLSPEIRLIIRYKSNCEISKQVGKLVAKQCLIKGITQVIFDRGKKLYHGKIKVLAESAREEGINF